MRRRVKLIVDGMLSILIEKHSTIGFDVLNIGFDVLNIGFNVLDIGFNT